MYKRQALRGSQLLRERRRANGDGYARRRPKRSLSEHARDVVGDFLLALAAFAVMYASKLRALARPVVRRAGPAKRRVAAAAAAVAAAVDRAFPATADDDESDDESDDDRSDDQSDDDDESDDDWADDDWAYCLLDGRAKRGTLTAQTEPIHVVAARKARLEQRRALLDEHYPWDEEKGVRRDAETGRSCARLHIRIVQARSLPQMRRHRGSCDSYVEVAVDGAAPKKTCLLYTSPSPRD